MSEWHELNDGFRWAQDETGVVIVSHICDASGKRCAGRCSNHQIVSLDPLHLEPSLIMPDCHAHGFIRDGRWQAA